MTTSWKPSGEWAGATVAVLACSPEMNQDVAEALSGYRRIAVNHAIQLAPAADMLVALDGNWPQEFREFAGMRLTGIHDDSLDALYVGHISERVTMAPGHSIEVRNSGLSAIRIAAQMGAAKIILAGFDPQMSGHFYDSDVHEYIGLAQGIAALTAELTAAGVQVERYTSDTSDTSRRKAKRV